MRFFFRILALLFFFSFIFPFIRMTLTFVVAGQDGHEDRPIC